MSSRAQSRDPVFRPASPLAPTMARPVSNRKFSMQLGDSQPTVTSDLDPPHESADHGQGGGGIRAGPRKRPNSFVFKILTSNSFALKILPTLFAKPAPVKPFNGVGGRGGALATPKFPKRTWIKNLLRSRSSQFIFARYPEAVSPA